MADEVIPAAEIFDLLDKQWSDTAENPKPQLFDLGRDGRTLTVDLDRMLAPTAGRRDLIIIRPGAPTEFEPIGNWIYENRTYHVTLELYSIASRQRLYNMMSEVRRIMNAKMHTPVGFQRIFLKNFEETYEDNFNLFIGSCEIELVNNSILRETT